jgi:hypothetical protein
VIERSAEWRRFVARAKNTRYGRSYGLGACPHPLFLQAGPGKPRRLLYFTKRSLPSNLWHYIFTDLPGDLAMFWQSWFPSRHEGDFLIRYAREVRRPIFFVGDLNPIGLTRFADLRSRGVPVEYLGLGDRWFQLCLKYRRPFGTSKGLDSISSIRLDETGFEHLAMVNRLLPDLEKLVGPESFAFLQSGRTIELEGAAALSNYRKSFLPALLDLLLGRAKSRK